MENRPDYHGRFTWFDLMTSDPSAVADFYVDVFGWDTDVWEGDPEKPYTMFVGPNGPMAGVMPLPPEVEAPTHWLPYLGTADLDATLSRMRTHGGHIHREPFAIPTVGRVAIVADPVGAVFAAFEPEGEAPGHDGLPAVGEFSWFELATDDPEGALAFFQAIYGWEAGEAMDMGEEGLYHMFARNGYPRGGIYRRPEHIPVSAWLLYARVEDLDAALDKIRAHDGQVLHGPIEVPGGDLVAICADPQGAGFAVHWANPATRGAPDPSGEAA